MQKRDHLGCNILLMGSQLGPRSIKTSNVDWYIVFLCISELPTPYQFKNKLRTIQPRHFGKN